MAPAWMAEDLMEVWKLQCREFKEGDRGARTRSRVGGSIADVGCWPMRYSSPLTHPHLST